MQVVLCLTVGYSVAPHWYVVKITKQGEGRTMKVQDIMISHVKSCHPDTNLAEAAQIMWANDVGALPGN